jgi:acetyltransferase
MKFDKQKANAVINEGFQGGHLLLGEIESKTLLEAYGITVNTVVPVASVKDAVQQAKALGFPVVMKISLKDFLNNLDTDNRKMTLNNEDEVRILFGQFKTQLPSSQRTKRLNGITVQSKINEPDGKLILGSRKDTSFGPVIYFRRQGEIAETVKGHALALPPLNRLLARRLIEGAKIYQTFKGGISDSLAAINKIEELLIRLSQLLIDFPDIQAVEINPLFVVKDEICVADARVLLKKSQVPSGQHLVISPYPSQHEAHVISKKGERLFIRPIRPEDAPILVKFFDELSARSVYLRFFTRLKRLPHWMLARFTQIDYDREMALIALPEDIDLKKILGVARIITELDRKQAEFSIVTTDEWQGQGVGAELLKRCLAVAEEMGVERVHGIVLAENTQMRALGKKLGMEMKRVAGSNEYELTMTFPNPFIQSNLATAGKEAGE